MLFQFDFHTNLTFSGSFSGKKHAELKIILNNIFLTLALKLYLDIMKCTSILKMKFLVQAVQKYTAQIDATKALPIFVGHDSVTVPLGLWMFERPGELRLNHSWLKFRTIYWSHFDCTQFVQEISSNV